jgi:hypothetical protein
MRKNSTPAAQSTNECRIKLKLSGSEKAEYVFPAMTFRTNKREAVRYVLTGGDKFIGAVLRWPRCVPILHRTSYSRLLP